MKASRALKLSAAYGLDSLLGDPEDYPHPVRLMGRSIAYLEARLKMEDRDEAGQTHAGCLLAGIVVGGTGLATRMLGLLPGWNIMEIVLMYTCLARKDLERSALRVAEAIEEGDIRRARLYLKALVGRDTHLLDKNAICRAAVESVAENFVDGVLVPMVWGALGGAPGAMSFKAVSTLDSMIGHRDESHMHSGKCAARVDDLAVFPWARASIPLVALAARLCGYDAAAAMSVGFRHRMNHESPNSAHPEAAFAGALGLRLGGASTYGGRRRELPEIGEGEDEVEPGHIREAVNLLNMAALLGLALAMALTLNERMGRWM